MNEIKVTYEANKTAMCCGKLTIVEDGVVLFDDKVICENDNYQLTCPNKVLKIGFTADVVQAVDKELLSKFNCRNCNQCD